MNNLQSNNKELIQFFQDDLKRIDTKINTIQKETPTLKNKKLLLHDKIKYLESKCKLLHRKYQHQTNQKLLQELSSLSNFIL